MVKCQECGGKLYIDKSKMYQGILKLPTYKCKCTKCGNIQYEYCVLCDTVLEELKDKLEEQSLW